MADELRVYCVSAERAADGTAEGLPPDVPIRRWTKDAEEAWAWVDAAPEALTFQSFNAEEIEALPPKFRAEARAKLAE